MNESDVLTAEALSKMPIMDRKQLRKQSELLDTVKNHANKKMSLKINEGIGRFYE